MIPGPSAPVIVGAAAVVQHIDDPSHAIEAMLLMRRALEAAADDAGSRSLLDAADVVMMPQGTWVASDPAAVVAPWSPTQRSVVADIGVLQQTLLSRACAMIDDGSAEIVLVCGGEAKYRALRGQRTGTVVGDTLTAPADGDRPLERLVPAHEIITDEEIRRGLPVPARQYALIDTALRAAQGLTPQQHRTLLAELWSGFSTVAASNPDAWVRTPVAADEFVEPTGRNSMLAWPYTKLHCSQWNVDQASAVILCSATAAARFGIARDRWVFAHVGVESNLMVPLTLRAEMHRSPAVRIAGEALLRHTGTAAGDVDLIDLYSCFPAAVRVQAAELGLALDDAARPLTITGGMTFGGGPLNNASLQALARLVQRLRDEPTASGLVTNVSGMLTKYGMSAWSCTPPDQPYASLDITAAATAATATVHLDPAHIGAARVITYTVAFEGGVAQQGIVVGDAADGSRVLATTTDADLLASMTNDDWCGRVIAVDGASIT